MATVQTPNMVARAMSRPVASGGVGRPITAKGVRTLARSIIGRFDKTKHPEYQGHAYTAAEVSVLRKALMARGSRAVAQAPRKAPRKAATVRKVATVKPAPDVAS